MKKRPRMAHVIDKMFSMAAAEEVAYSATDNMVAGSSQYPTRKNKNIRRRSHIFLEYCNYTTLK